MDDALLGADRAIAEDNGVEIGSDAKTHTLTVTAAFVRSQLIHCRLGHRTARASLITFCRVRHQNTMKAIQAKANKVTASGMPLAISMRSVRVGILPLLLTKATKLFPSVCIADLGRGGS